MNELKEPLSDKDMGIRDLIVKGLSRRVGIENAITRPVIQKALKDKYNIQVSDPAFRKIIHHIRINYIIQNLIASTAKGYYIENDPAKLREYVNMCIGKAKKQILYAKTYNIIPADQLRLSLAVDEIEFPSVEKKEVENTMDPLPEDFSPKGSSDINMFTEA